MGFTVATAVGSVSDNHASADVFGFWFTYGQALVIASPSLLDSSMYSVSS
jgi:hypothetical protein